MLIEREVPDDDNKSSLHRLPPVLEDDNVLDASRADGPFATFDIHRLPAAVLGEKPLLGTYPPPRPTHASSASGTVRSRAGPGLAIQDAVGGMKNVPAMAVPTGDSVPPGPWVAVIPPPLSGESEPLALPLSRRSASPVAAVESQWKRWTRQLQRAFGWAPVPLPVRTSRWSTGRLSLCH